MAVRGPFVILGRLFRRGSVISLLIAAAVLAGGCSNQFSFSLGRAARSQSLDLPPAVTPPGTANGEGYEGKMDMAFRFTSAPTSCGLPYDSTLSWSPFGLDYWLNDSCVSSPVIIADSAVEKPLLYSVSLLGYQGSIYEIMDPRRAGSLNIASERLAVMWCRWLNPRDASESVDLVVRGTGGRSVFEITTSYALRASGGAMSVGTQGPLAVIEASDATKTEFSSGSTVISATIGPALPDGTQFGVGYFSVTGFPRFENVELRCRVQRY